jgi:hypothetical protein
MRCYRIFVPGQRVGEVQKELLGKCLKNQIDYKQASLFFSYPTVWLRDNCRCHDCFHPVSLNRMILMRNLNLDAKPEKVELSQDGKEVRSRNL